MEGADYVSLHTSWLISVIIRKKAFSFVNSDLELDFHSYIYIRVRLNSKTATYVNKLILTLFSPLDIKCRNLLQKNPWKCIFRASRMVSFSCFSKVALNLGECRWYHLKFSWIILQYSFYALCNI